MTGFILVHEQMTASEVLKALKLSALEPPDGKETLL